VENQRKRQDHHPRWTAQTGGIAEFYAGKPEAAMQLLQEAEKDEDVLLRGTAMVFRVMLLKKLNRLDDAARVLHEAERLIADPKMRSSMYWWAGEHCRLGLEEARRVIAPVAD
jgi:hypothetical protein